MLRLQGPGVVAEHAVIQVKGKHVFCRPSVREEHNPIVDTCTWLDDQPLRQGNSTGLQQHCRCSLCPLC